MPRKVVQKTSFLGGEAGYLLEGRSDLAQFQLGVLPGQNFISLRGGGTTRRPPTKYVKNTQADKAARLFPFVSSYDSAADIYVVEVALASATSLTFRVIRASDGAVYTPTGSPLTVASTIDLSEIQVTQSADLLFICHKSFTPQILYRATSAPTFTLEGYVAYSTGSRTAWQAVPYRDANVTATTLSIDVATVGTGRVITASTAIFPDNSVIGAFYRMKTSGGTDGWFQITAWTSTTVVTVTVLSAISAAASATTDWSEGAWSSYRGFPRTVTLYSQRLAWGGNTSQPDTFWMSQVSDYFQMSGGTGISDPLNFTLASSRPNQIRWMVGGKKLTIGTSTSEWVGTVTNDGTNLFVQFDEETTHGSAPVQPQKSAYTIPFVQRAGQSIRELAFNFDNDAYEATDLTLFGSHVATAFGSWAEATEVRVKQLAYQESPFGILWVLDSEGRLFGLTRDRQQQIAAWHSHVLGGSNTGSLANHPVVTSICVVPNPTGTHDRLWMVVARRINGSTVYHVEYMEDIRDHKYIVESTANDPPFLDCYTTQSAASTVSWSGYTRFASSTAYVVAVDNNGTVVQAGAIAVNASGEITLTTAAVTVYVGLHRDAILRLLPIEGGDGIPINMRSAKMADSAVIRMYQTYGLRIGKNRIPRMSGNEDNTTFEPIPFVSVPTSASSFAQIQTFTGTREVQVPNDADGDLSFALAMQDPWPCTILSISTGVVANEV
jgi:hypothetical protein